MKNSILCLLLSIFITSCGIYSFTGASIPNGAETVSVAYFQNNALTVQPSLSNTITESVKRHPYLTNEFKHSNYRWRFAICWRNNCLQS